MNSLLQAQARAQAQAQVAYHAEPAQQGPRERLLKARLPDIYYGKSHTECYHFWQQCEDHFNTHSTTCPNRTPFTTSFLRGRIRFCWLQYKRLNHGEGVTLILARV